MNHTVLRAALLICMSLAAFSAAWGQSATFADSLKLVKPSGERRWTEGMPPTMQLKSGVTEFEGSLEQVLKANGIAYDANTRKMFEQLNPELGNSTRLRAGTKFNFIGLDEDTLQAFKRQGTLLGFDEAVPTQTYGRYAEYQMARYKALADGYDAKSFHSDADRASYQIALAQATIASKGFSDRSAGLSGLEYGLAADRLDYVNIKAAEIDRLVKSGGVVPQEKLSVFQELSTFLNPSASGQKLTRKVKVVVVDSTGREVKGLTVYALPAPFFDDPKAYPESIIRDRLIRYSFFNETSPSVSDVDGMDARVWVGPRKRYDEMVALIRENKAAFLGKYSTLNESTLGKKDVEIRLAAPEDVVKLPR